MRIIIIIYLLLFLCLQGFGQSNLLISSLDNLFKGKPNSLNMILSQNSKEKLGFYLEKDTVLRQYIHEYEIKEFSRTKMDNLWQINLSINDSIFSFEILELPNKNYSLELDETTFRKLFWNEPIISYNFGTQLYELGYLYDGFHWMHQSAKTGYPLGQLYLFKDILMSLAFSSTFDNLYDSMYEIVNITPKSFLLDKTKNIENILKEIETFKIHVFLQTYDYDALLEIYKEKAKSGNPKDMNRLANAYPLFKRDYNGGEHLNAYWYRKSAEKGDESAMEQIAGYYESELILGIDYEKAFYWYNKLYEQNNQHPVIIKLIEYYYLGKGIDKNKEKAIELLEKAMELAREKENWKIAEGLANIFYGDIPDLKNEKRALWYYKKAAYQYSNEAYRRHMELLEYGY